MKSHGFLHPANERAEPTGGKDAQGWRNGPTGRKGVRLDQAAGRTAACLRAAAAKAKKAKA